MTRNILIRKERKQEPHHLELGDLEDKNGIKERREITWLGASGGSGTSCLKLQEVSLCREPFREPVS